MYAPHLTSLLLYSRLLQRDWQEANLACSKLLVVAMHYIRVVVHELCTFTNIALLISLTRTASHVLFINSTYLDDVVHVLQK